MLFHVYWKFFLRSSLQRRNLKKAFFMNPDGDMWSGTWWKRWIIIVCKDFGCTRLYGISCQWNWRFSYIFRRMDMFEVYHVAYCNVYLIILSLQLEFLMRRFKFQEPINGYMLARITSLLNLVHAPNDVYLSLKTLIM